MFLQSAVKPGPALLALCSLSLAIAATSVHAQSADTYPTKPIRLIVPFPPGGSNDIIGRYLANHLTERFGKLKALGTGGAKRTTVLPDVPAIAEDLPGYEANNWWGILAPAATPPAIVKKLNIEINRVMQLPETQKRFSSEGADPVSGTPEDFSKLISGEMVKWAKVAKSANIKAE